MHKLSYCKPTNGSVEKMKKIIALAVPAIALGLLTGCEDKAAEEAQKQKIEQAINESMRLSSEIQDLKRENAELNDKMSKIAVYLKKKEMEAAAKAAPKTTKSSTAQKTGTKTSAPAKKP
jgi:predicted lipoprotein